MKKRDSFIALVVALGTVFGAQLSFAKDHLGGDIPAPFDSRNRFVELAPLSHYELKGEIKRSGDHHVLVVDLDQHPWLKNAKNLLDPSYILELGSDMTIRWEDFENEYVKADAQAQGEIIEKNGFKAFQIKLVMKDLPVIVVKEEPDEEEDPDEEGTSGGSNGSSDPRQAPIEESIP